MILDTNVLVAANGGATHLSLQCEECCSDELVESRSHVVALDDDGRILDEYRRNVLSTFPWTPGLTFLRELLQNLGNPGRCELVLIGERKNSFVEFPDDETLVNFDRSDRKFVAVSCASPNLHEIHVASDRGWTTHQMALRRHGVVVNFVCPNG